MARSRFSSGSSRKSGGGAFKVVLLLAVIGGAAVGGYFMFGPKGDGQETTDPATGTPATATNPQPATPTAMPGLMPGVATQPATAPVATAPVATAATTPAVTTPVATPPVTSQPTATPPTPTPAVPREIELVRQGGEIDSIIADANRLIAAGNKIQARALLSELLFARYEDLLDSNKEWIREQCNAINNEILWTMHTLPNDDLVKIHEFKGGTISGLGNQTWMLPLGVIQKLNGNLNPRNVQVGQKLRYIKGPLHARVDQSDYRMDIYAERADGVKVFVKSYRVGLGKDGGTPCARYHTGSGKMENPEWYDRRDGNKYYPPGPDNPIGIRWIPLYRDGVKTDLGVHGTNQPDSIGKNESRGCIRLTNEDVVEVYGMLFGGRKVFSYVDVVP